MSSERRAEHSECTQEPMFSVAAIYAHITKEEPKLCSGVATLPVHYKTPSEDFLFVALKEAYFEAIAGSPITMSDAQDLFKRTFVRKNYHNPMSIGAHLHVTLRWRGSPIECSGNAQITPHRALPLTKLVRKCKAMYSYR